MLVLGSQFCRIGGRQEEGPGRGSGPWGGGADEEEEVSRQEGLDGPIFLQAGSI